MLIRAVPAVAVWCCLMSGASFAAAEPAQKPEAQRALGAPPPAAALPRLEFAFEARVTLAPPVVLGDTAFGHRQYIPITGGRIAGPKFSGEVLSGGWDYQLGLSDGCNMLAADYFIRAQDGTVIHVVNEGLSCGAGQAGGARSYFRPRLEAPKGPHEWMTRATFVASLELEQAAGQGAQAPRALEAVRLRFYQVE